MASVKVAVRVRPFVTRETQMSSKCIIKMCGKKTMIFSGKGQDEAAKVKEFTFDHSYWSHDSNDANFASQEQVFQDLGMDIVDSAFKGYNACLFAYGQTGSGKTFTMMGTPEDQGIIPRICESLFNQMICGASYRMEISYLEIYNEKVKDLLASNPGQHLRIREHPELGPIVQDLSKHLVSDYAQIQNLMNSGNQQRTTARTNMNDCSSRSHSIFTIQFVKAGFCKGLPTETVSKIHLVDLAGSERANATGATGQLLKEGGHINKSLVTLGSVISALAELSANPDRRKGKHFEQKNDFIPYRNSTLTWLLKDSLGGNSKSIMIAAISPAACNYTETLSTLRYANRAKNIINKPTINEDSNVKLIRELRDEIRKLKSFINSNCTVQGHVLETLHEKEKQEKVLTKCWTEKWKETQIILQEQEDLALRKAGTGVVLDSERPHLICIEDKPSSTGVTLYHLKDGETLIGTEAAPVEQHIILSGKEMEPEHCVIMLKNGEATLIPKPNAPCWVNGMVVTEPLKLFQGCKLHVGRTNMFRYIDPAQAKQMRREGNISQCELNLSELSLMAWSTPSLASPSCEHTGLLSERVEKLLNGNKSEDVESWRRSSELRRSCENSSLPSPQSVAASLPSIHYAFASDETNCLEVRVPCFYLRGSGSGAHYVYEVMVHAGSESWYVLRRYSRFRELYLNMKALYKTEVSCLIFPPRKLFNRRSEGLAKKRRPQLEFYLQSLFRICEKLPSCPLYSTRFTPTKESVLQFSNFFRRGNFEPGKYSTG